MTNLVVNREYEPGNSIIVETSEQNIHMWLQVDDAAITIDFGRLIETDKVIMYTRADFPHDNWWTQVTLTFSDGSSIDWKHEKSRFAYMLTFEKKQIIWVQKNHMIKADDSSPFPALSQLEVYGTVVK